MPIKLNDPRLPQRFWSKVTVNPDSGCWEWTAAKDRDGYAMFRTPDGMRRGHRVAYLTLVGPIDAETLNHDCAVRHCVNPNTDHAATPMSSVDNVRDGKRRVTRCPQGHPYDEANTMLVGPEKNRRACRRCYNDRSAEYWRTTRSAAEKSARRASGYRGGYDETATCRHGHPRTEENTYTAPNGYRSCKACRNDRSRGARRTTA